uniref:Sec-independent protein translocase component TatC n=1 Tax=Thuretia quercifolia TaxID=189650 RepID=A0A1Z1ML08_9FLOR|nr:Sec-independent protein translocase component TatC [Thuretia quercifolia]ARW66431.1 Sec-independent protein translocase component TatC [Thuretia quercifolia]
MKKIYKSNIKDRMSIIEHLEELRTRLFYAFIIFCITTIVCLAYTKNISFIIEKPALGIKFLQLAPGEYIFVSIKMSLYLGIIFSSPFFLYQIIIFILPGLTKKEALYVIPTLLGSIILFFTGIFFSYKILIPAALKFLVSYGSDIVEPIWSFEEYFNFISLLSFSTGIAFQIPIIQILLGLFKVLTSNKMLQYWKYVVFISTIISAILTPSTDPITQIFMSFAILILYFSGIFILKTLQK